MCCSTSSESTKSKLESAKRLRSERSFRTNRHLSPCLLRLSASAIIEGAMSTPTTESK